jgi:ParB-like nuclease domain
MPSGGRAILKNESIKYVDGLKGTSAVFEVSLSEIDLKNDPCQFRFKANPGYLLASLRGLGRQHPVILSGKAAPYKIVDGHRRINAFKTSCRVESWRMAKQKQD